ncbi:aminotransferase-like domain-containing protein [Staphylococcus saprophyticus]|uniref:aminotransferase-like domain-containing protein n=1 Tax=Staphylococcus saprophyticus TaxID=29385 RepID=UPI00384ACAF9
MKYKDIASYIRKKIINGDWFYGMRIPSQRKLSDQFNVNRVTIIKSIELLESEGFIYTVQGSGTYVNDYLDKSYIINKWDEMMEWSSRTRSQYTVQLINKLETHNEYIHISKGELGDEILPHKELKKAMNRVSDYIGDLSFGYNNGHGYIRLRELIAKRLEKQNINVSSENILITSGALHAIQLLSIGFLSQNTIIFRNTPSYVYSTNVFDILNMRSININYNLLKQSKSILNSYSNAYNKALYIESTFNNPTGDILSTKVREQILNYSNLYNIPIIEDDIYRDIWFENEPNASIKSLDKNGNVIYISSFSKTIAPAMRIGWIAASEKVVEQLGDIRMQIDYGSSILSQMVVYEMLKSGDYDEHTKNVRYKLQNKRDFMLNILNSDFSSIATWKVPEGGFFVWITFKDGVNIKKLFVELADKEHILINPGYIYGSTQNTIRLSFSYESNENIKYALNKLREYVNQI